MRLHPAPVESMLLVSTVAGCVHILACAIPPSIIVTTRAPIRKAVHPLRIEDLSPKGSLRARRFFTGPAFANSNSRRQPSRGVWSSFDSTSLIISDPKKDDPLVAVFDSSRISAGSSIQGSRLLTMS